MGLVAGPISANSLMEKLAMAKKLMTKVESGDFERGNIDESMLIDENVQINSSEIMLEDYSEEKPSQNLLRPVSAPPDVNRINQTKLPDAIKRAMLEKPIPVPDISLSDTVDMDIFKGAKRLIEQENKEKRPTSKGQSFTSQKQTQAPKQIVEVDNSDLLQSLIPIIENTIRKVLDEKLTQLLSVQQTQTISENLVLRVGDSIFQGKITGVKKAK